MERRLNYTPQHVFNYGHNASSRAITPINGPFVRPEVPVEYWVQEPLPLPVRYRPLYASPPRTHSQVWYPGLSPQYVCNPTQLTQPPPPLPPTALLPLPTYYDPNAYKNFAPPHPQGLTTRDFDQYENIKVENQPKEAKLSSEPYNSGCLKICELNPYEPPTKWISSTKLARTDYNTKKCKNKEENCEYDHNKFSSELHPEILATWRKCLHKSKESSSTHKLKIEICFKDGMCQPNQKIAEHQTIHSEINLNTARSSEKRDSMKMSKKSKHQKKMSSTGSAASKSSLKKVESNSLQVSPTKVTRVSATNEKRSALKFIPQQIHKVHKRSKDRCHRSLIRRSDNNYTPILDALKARGLRDDDESQRKNDIETPVRGGSPEPSRQPSLNISNRARSPEPSRKSSSNTSRRSKSPEESGKSRSSRDRSSETSRKSHKSTHERDQSSESVLENDRYRKISPVRYSLSQSSVLSRNSCSDQNLDDDSSIYVTPEQTSVSMRSPDENRRTSSFKRSLCDDHQDESHSNNSSFNDSSYQTPESTPSKFNSAKRMKIRWSETSVFNQDSSSYLSWRLNLSSTSEQGIQPELIGYQMVGDSQFCRFGQQLLGLQRVPMPNSPGRIGMCVSGQTITDLHRRVKEGFYPISEKIILMIGTNDFLRNVNVSRMCEELSALIKTLQKNASTIILLTLPPIPKLAKKSVSHFELLDVYNQHIRSLENGETLRIADISPLYMTCPPYQRCRMHLFELFFGGAEKRHDLIHLNRLGLEVIRKYSFLFSKRQFVMLMIETEEQLLEEVESEVRDYAIKIGINPDTEKHLLNIALDGLMSPLPEEWKACLDERVNRIYYYNAKTHQTQWNHPLDEHFENLVRKKRQDESISAGDDDSKTSIKEDLKSFEEAVTTSDMMPSRHLPTTHKSRLTSPSKQPLAPVKDPSPDGRKVLNPIGRPPLPPKRRAASTSPKRLSLRLGSSPSSAPSPGRIDIDSIGIPVSVTAGLPSPDKGDKPGARSPGIKLTGGGSAFLKSKQKLSPSPSEETKKLVDDSNLKSFEIVREAESIESPDEKSPNKEIEDRKLKHSTSLGESGFDKLIKSKKFMSLQESLLNLKSELEMPSSELKSPNTSGLRGILRDKPSPTTKLWDIDPALLTSEEKEKLRFQEMKDERKQNVRFADIINKPINIEFSKSDSEDDSTTNDSSNDLDDLILENMHSDDELRKENKLLENSLKLDMKLDDNENTKVDSSPESLTKDMSSPGSNRSNRNIISRLSDLSVDSKKKRDITKFETDNNKDIGNWLTDTEDIMNQNEKKIQALRKNVYDITKLSWDIENNPVDKHLTQLGFVKTPALSPVRQGKVSSPMNKMQMGTTNKDSNDSYQMAIQKMKQENASFMDPKKINDEPSDNLISKNVRKSRLMPNVDLQKVFQSVKESLANSSEHSDSEVEVEPMETSPLGPAGDEDSPGVGYRTDDRAREKYDRHRDRIFEEYKERQKKVFEEKKSLVYQDYDETMEEIKNELKKQESIERQRIHEEVQQSMIRFKEEVEVERNQREAEIRNKCEEYLKKVEAVLTSEKELKIKKMEEEHEAFIKDLEKRLSEEKAQFEEEKKIRMHTSSSQLEKIVAELKEKEEQEILRLKEESDKKIDAVRKQVEQEQVEQEKRHKQELAIVDAECEKVLGDKRRAVEQLKVQQESEIAATRVQHQAALDLLAEQHTLMVRQLQDQAREEEEFIRRKHSEKMEVLNAQLSRTSEKEDLTQLNREFEKVRCEKRLLEDKYKSLKEKYVRLKSEVRLSMERKRQAKLNRQLQQQRDPASTTEDTSADHGKPPLARKKLVPAFSSDEGTGDNANGTPKTIKRRPKPTTSMTTSSAAEQSSSSAPPQRPKNVWNPSPQQRREGVSSAEDSHTSVSEEIQLEQDNCGDQWLSAMSPLENLRKQLEKLDDLEEQFPTSVHTDTYLRYPFSGPAGGSCELDFYRHRLHLERESVRRAKQALAEQRLNIEARQLQLRHRQHTQTLNTLHNEERELTDLEVSLHRTRALLGEKIIRLRYLEQSIDRAAAFTPHHSHSHDSITATNTDSSGFSGSDLDLSNAAPGVVARSDVYWTENVLLSLENINSEIREIWSILGKQQVPGLGPPPVLNYENRAIAGTDYAGLAPQRATDIADRTRKLKEWLVRTREQQTYMVAPVNL